MDTEEKIKDLGLTAPRITPEHIEATIAKVEFHQLTQRRIICVLTLVNGFEVTGESSCVSVENFNEALGQEIAKGNAVDKIWELEGYLLKERLHYGQ